MPTSVPASTSGAPPPAVPVAAAEHFVFISYSTVDREVAETLCGVLENGGVRCWIAPRDVQPGREWRPSIIEAIERCHVMVLVFSDEANRSHQVSREVEVAFDEGKTIIPFRIQNTEMNRSLRYCISATHWLDALTPPLSDHAERLVSTVRGVMEDVARRAPATREAASPSTSAEETPVAEPAPAPVAEAVAPGKKPRVPRAPVAGAAVEGETAAAGAVAKASRRNARTAPAAGEAQPAPPRTTRSRARGGAPARRSSAQAGAARLKEKARRGRAWWRLRGRAVSLAGLALLLAGSAVAGVWFGTRKARAGDGPGSLSDGPVVAVLPFADRSPDRQETWRAEEMSAEIITALARLPAMRVIARSSAFAFRDSTLDVREIGRRLGARYVLEGSVGRVGDRLRVEALLVSVEGGYQVWSNSYNRVPADVVTLQDEIARGIVGKLRPRDEAVRRGQARRATADPQAYDLFLQARHSWAKRTPEGLASGMDLLERALQRDPSFAQAHAGVAECHALLVGYGASTPAEGYPRARAAAQRALALDSTLSQAHAVLGLVSLYHDRDWAAAGRELTLAIRADPSNVTARRWYASYLAYQGLSDEALQALEQTQKLDPFSAEVYSTASTLLYYAGRYDESIDRSGAVLMISPGFWPAHSQNAAAYMQMGRYPEALAELDQAWRKSGGHAVVEAGRGYAFALSGKPDQARAAIRRLEALRRSQYVPAAYIALVHAALGEPDPAMEWLERAYQEHDDWVAYLGIEPAFNPLRADPRFRALVRRAQGGP